MDMGNIFFFCSLLVRVLATLLPGAVLFRLLYTILRRGRGGTAVPHFLLFAGAGADTISSFVGALTFYVAGLPSWTAWVFGSALSSQRWCECWHYFCHCWCFYVCCGQFSVGGVVARRFSLHISIIVYYMNRKYMEAKNHVSSFG